MNRLIALISPTWRAALWACSLALVLSAWSGVAQASNPNNNNNNNGGNGQNSTSSAPEIDPGSSKAALMLLGGSVLLVTDRLRRRSR
jgi:hypothetical protein